MARSENTLTLTRHLATIDIDYRTTNETNLTFSVVYWRRKL